MPPIEALRIEKSHPDILVGLIGEGIQASRSPLLHEEEARALGLRYCYRLIDLRALGLGAEALPRLLDAAQLLGFSGVNITHPCKQTVLPFLDELSDDVASIGAVNTVVFTNGERIGHNTDCWGFAESFRRSLAGAPLGNVVLLGAGGAGRPLVQPFRPAACCFGN
jgi:shikimate dehydrogenase